ncbi:MAG: hypothetical protein M1497_15915 [Nitrospirae bacterium]|nr:hypothetical protein [Nitrospirota bacterium]
MNREYMKEHNEKVTAQLRKQGPVSFEKRKQQALKQLKRSQPAKSGEKQGKDIRSLVESHQEALKEILAEVETMTWGKAYPSMLKKISDRANRPVEQMIKNYEGAELLRLERHFQLIERTLKWGPVLYPEKKVKIISDNPRYEPAAVNPEQVKINA